MNKYAKPSGSLVGLNNWNLPSKSKIVCAITDIILRISYFVRIGSIRSHTKNMITGTSALLKRTPKKTPIIAKRKQVRKLNKS